jgi:hypothetical protein
MTIDEELLASALALMTAHAEAPRQRQIELASVVGRHVLLIAVDLSASSEFRQILSVLAAHWNVLADPRARTELPSGDPNLWHPAPDCLH